MTISQHVSLSKNHPVIYYDAQCLLCDGFIKSLIQRDPSGIIKYCSLQDDKASEIRRLHDIQDQYKTVILLYQGKWYFESDVAIQIAKYLEGPWSNLRNLQFIPKPIRNWGYSLISNNRYSLFGKSDECILPDADISSRFL
jgi:predicted DCC family thiol-disulfide oxidoreductase YuxK